MESWGVVVDPGFVVDACQIDYLHQQSHHHEKPISIEANLVQRALRLVVIHYLEIVLLQYLPNEGLVVHRVSCSI